MTIRRQEAGFTLLEVMFATAIFSIVAASLVTFFIGVQQLSRRATATAELSVAMRELREKLLFHAQPVVNGVMRSGLLSGYPSGYPQNKSPIEAQIKVLVDAPFCTKSTGEKWTMFDNNGDVQLSQIQLLNDSGRFKNDGASDPWRTLWFRFGGSVGGGASSGLKYLGDDVFNGQGPVISRGIYFISLCASMQCHGLNVNHGERIAVPVFGVKQEKNQTSVFHDNLLSTQ